MFFNLVLLILSIILDAIIFFFSPISGNIALIWINVLLLLPLFIGLFAFELLTFLIWGLFINKKIVPEKANDMYLFIVNQVIQQLTLFSRTRMHVTGLEKLPKDGNFVLLFNHLSNWDPMVIINTMPKRKILCVSKDSNLKIPIAGPFIHKAGFIAFDRSDKNKSAEATIRAIRFLRGNKYSIAIAPEGTRNKERKQTLLDFHYGCFKMATKTHKPIVVCVVKNTYMIHKNFPFKNTHVDLSILETITYETYQNMEIEQLKEYTFNLMKDALEA